MTLSGEVVAGSGALAVPHDHAVQFYEDESYLYDIVADFIAGGLINFEPAIVIATPTHRQGFLDRLAEKGFDVEELCREGHLTLLDARETLACFMDGRLPDAAKCKSTIGSVLTKIAEGRQSTRIRLYGEMVDVLWREGAAQAALRLENLWNELATVHTFQLLCAYPIGNFYKQSHAAEFDAICATHSMVVPTEARSGDDRDALLRQIAALQQRSEALKTEITNRTQLEHALRDALNERWDAEDALRRNERELKDFLDNATVGLHWVAEDGTILWANDAELNLLGYARDEYLGRNIRELHADRDAIDDILTTLKSGGEVRDRRARLVAKDGSIRHVAISSNALFEDGRFVHTRCFTRDVTQQTQLEQERTFMLDATTVLNRSLDYESRLRELACLVVPRLAEWCAVDVDGQRVATAGAMPETAEKLVVPMKSGDRVLGWITLAGHDTSEHLANELARRAAIAIDNARLYRLAEEGSRAKDEFLATLSHELRTPLTAILGWARLLRGGPLDAELTATALETIERSATAQAAVIDDILDLSNVVRGKLALERNRIDLVSMTVNAIDALRLAAMARRVAIDFRPSKGPAFVTGDATRLQQIAWNLLSNAIKFSSPDRTVRVEIERTDEQAKLIVRDEGCGIRPEFLPHVFEPFRQAESSSTRTHGGLGLGLAIVKSLVELHGGAITAASAGDSRGSTFTVTLPSA